jgi:neutral amino acid transport system permease protein
VFEERVFNKFRERGDDLATLLIVALGLSFVLRFGVQAFYGGQVRAYDIPDVASLAGVELPLSAVQNVNVYGVDGGVVVQVVDTLPDPAVTTVVVGYGPVALAALAVVPLAAALAGYRWRGGSDDVFTSGQTVGPKLTAALAWLVATGVLVATLAGDATVPERYAWGTQLSPSVKRLSTLVIAAGMLTVLHLLLNETKLGVAMRAASDNLDLAKVTGINTRRVIVAAWIIAGLFSAIAGVMIGILFTSITPNTGFFFLLPIFGGVILGGVDSVYGAVLGSYVVGLSMELGIFFLPISGTLRVPVAFVVLLVVLLVKPEGLLGGS